MILASVRELDIHATAEQIYAHVIKKHPNISKATVYRNLGQMAEAGELLNIGSIRGCVHYDHNCRRHYHFVCAECGQVFDVDSYYPELDKTAAGLEGFQITGHSLTFSGVCRDCGARKTI